MNHHPLHPAPLLARFFNAVERGEYRGRDLTVHVLAQDVFLSLVRSSRLEHPFPTSEGLANAAYELARVFLERAAKEAQIPHAGDEAVPIVASEGEPRFVVHLVTGGTTEPKLAVRAVLRDRRGDVVAFAFGATKAAALERLAVHVGAASDAVNAARGRDDLPTQDAG